MAPSAPLTVYAYVGDGLFKTTNGGATWRRLPRFTSEVGLTDGVLAVDPSTANTAYLALSGDENTGQANGIFRTIDGGTTWTGPLETSFLPTRFGAMTIDPSTPSTLYVTEYHDNGVYKSTDRGVTWTSLGLVNPGPLAIDPSHPARLYVAANSETGLGNDLFRSRDGGSTWRAALAGEATSSVAVAPSHPCTVYASTVDGLAVSHDAGATWIKRATPGSVNSLAVDPQRPGTVYIAVPPSPGGGVWKSTDGGRTWHAFGTGLPTGNFHDFVDLLVDSTGRRLHLVDAYGLHPRVWDYTDSSRPTALSDTLLGTERNDVIPALAGNDRVWGFAGNDLIFGGRGVDRVYAGPGDDVVRLVDGDVDFVDCGDGTDTVYANERDVVAASCEHVSRSD